MLIDDPAKGRIDHLRIGEGILLGLETVNRKPIVGTSQDAFKVEGEVIEAKVKPTLPFGKVTQNAFGDTPEFEDLGEVRRLVIALGRQDTIPGDLEPVDENVKLFDGSSDHMVLHDKAEKYEVGDKITFIPSYGALVSLFTSRYVKRRYI
jgi:predicted amino acid racemase